MIIYLFRHGETDWNRQRRLQGRIDIPLNEFGRELAVKTAEALREVPFDRAFSSPLGRAVETAKILLRERETILETDERLIEISFGQYEGAGYEEVKGDPANPLYNFFRRTGGYVPPVGAESFQEIGRRASEFLKEKILPLEGSCENVLVVAHGAFNRSLLNPIAGVPMERFWKIDLGNCAASILKLENGRLEIVEESRVYYGEAVNGRP